jgi:hypothetical protein
MTTSVPSSPEAFFTSYVPERIARLSAALAGRSSPGSVLFDVPGVGSWSLSLKQGSLLVVAGEQPDRLLTIAIRSDDFAPIIVTGAERVPEDLPPERQMIAARILTLDAERAKLVSGVTGSLGLALKDGAVTRRLLIAPPKAPVVIEQPSCEVSCSLDDFWAMQGGVGNPFELLMDGRLTLAGDMQIAMALSGVFA